MRYATFAVVRRWCAFLRGLAVLLLLATASTVGLAQSPVGSGRIGGRVADQQNNRPLAEATVSILGRPAVVQTDVDGRYRTEPLPAGRYSIRVTIIGYQPVQIDSVAVEDGKTATIDVAMHGSAVQLQEIVSENQAAAERTSADAGLLAARRSAAAVTDGVSAEAMTKAPDADASDAATRVTGMSVFDNKYVIVRGLGERYSGSQLNGAEVASPVLEKKVVPLDLFPSSFLESIVVSKTATPDKPADFAGGSVEIKTKDFPENRVREFALSRGYNSLASRRDIPLPPRGGTDWLAIDDGRRQPPAFGAATEQGAETFRNFWIPSSRQAPLESGGNLALGDQFPVGNDGLGYIFSLNYGAGQHYSPRSLSLPSATRTMHASAAVEWGGIFNLAYRFGSTTKLGFKNLYSRSSEDEYRTAEFESQFPMRKFQLHYTERYLWQSQLTGDHQLRALSNSRLEWKATRSTAEIDEPDNHWATYTLGDKGVYALDGITPAERENRFLNDQTLSGQADWTLPVSFRSSFDAVLKIGGLYRAKKRDYRADDFTFNLTPDAFTAGIDTLPPDLAFAPENLGRYVTVGGSSNAKRDPYSANDAVAANYAMVDVPLTDAIRLVAGVRAEFWRLTFYPGGRDVASDAPSDPELQVHRYRNNDYLPSANLTVRLGERMNLRFAGSRTLARPDSRELSTGIYSPVIGQCNITGDPSLVRTRITNIDARWELYPSSTEIVSVGGFHKYLQRPLVETIESTPQGCFQRVRNGEHATVSGVEFEARKALDILPGFLRQLSLGANVTLARSSVTMPSELGTYGPLELVGQSPLLVNVNLLYETPSSPLGVSLLYNWVGDRVYAYGAISGGPQSPNQLELGQSSLDAKVRFAVSRRLHWSLSATNLTDGQRRIITDDPAGRAVARIEASGVKFSTSIGYVF